MSRELLLLHGMMLPGTAQGTRQPSVYGPPTNTTPTMGQWGDVLGLPTGNDLMQEGAMPLQSPRGWYAPQEQPPMPPPAPSPEFQGELPPGMEMLPGGYERQVRVPRDVRGSRPTQTPPSRFQSAPYEPYSGDVLPGPFGRSVQQDMEISGTPYLRAPSIRDLEAQIAARMERAQAAGRTYEEQNQFEYMMSRAQQAPSSVTPSRPPARKKPAGKSPAPASGSSEKFEMPKPRKYSQRDPFQKPAPAKKKAKPKPRNVDPPSGYGRGSVNDKEVTYPLARKRRK